MNEPALIRKTLDTGIRNLFVSHVDSADGVRRIVRAARFTYNGKPGGRGLAVPRASRWGCDDTYAATENELTYTWEEFNDLPQETQLQDFHCVTGWSRFDNEFTGVTFPTIADRADVHDDAEHVVFGSLDGYSTNLPLDECLRNEVLFVFELDGQPLPSEHGGPLRVVTPHKYAYKGAK